MRRTVTLKNRVRLLLVYFMNQMYIPPKRWIGYQKRIYSLSRSRRGSNDWNVNLVILNARHHFPAGTVPILLLFANSQSIVVITAEKERLSLILWCE